MPPALPIVYFARHGETEWSLSGQHTGLTDLPLTKRGERNARQLRARLGKHEFTKTFVSPLQRARQTCDLAGYGEDAEVDPDLVEWDYGDYEGITTAKIRETRPDWQIFRDGCPGGESLADISARADRVVARWRACNENLVVFSSGHFLRIAAARWCGLEANAGKLLHLSTASVSGMGYEHTLHEPVILFWNDSRHVGD